MHPVKINLSCPACSKPLMSRVAKLCSWCSAPVPDALRFTSEEIAQIQASEADAIKRRELVEQALAVQHAKQGVPSVTGIIARSVVVAAIIKSGQ
jgi:hypothetical protein